MRHGQQMGAGPNLNPAGGVVTELAVPLSGPSAMQPREDATRDEPVYDSRLEIFAFSHFFARRFRYLLYGIILHKLFRIAIWHLLEKGRDLRHLFSL